VKNATNAGVGRTATIFFASTPDALEELRQQLAPDLRIRLALPERPKSSSAARALSRSAVGPGARLSFWLGERRAGACGAPDGAQAAFTAWAYVYILTV
jgi:hypothetical protein